MTTRSIYQRARWSRPARAADSKAWREFCATIVDRIEAIRATEAPTTCPTCQSTTPAGPDTLKRCPHCQQSKPRRAFSRDRQAVDGRSTYCRQCRRRQHKDYRMRLALRRQPRLLEVSA